MTTSINPDLETPQAKLTPEKHLAYEVLIDGQPAELIHTPCAAIVRTLFLKPATIEVRCRLPIRSAVIRPLCLGISPEILGRTLRFFMESPSRACLELNEDLNYPLLILADHPVELPQESPGLVILDEGEHDASEVKLESHSVIYLAHGARLRGALHLKGLTDVKILGTGIIDPIHDNPKLNRTAIQFEQCENITISGPLAFMSERWGCIVRRCRNIKIHNLKLVGHGKCSDGIDIDGSHHVRVSGCFIKNNDDCLCIKSSPLAEGASVVDVEFSDCTLWNGPGGNGIELGYESQTDSFRDITFRNIDIIHVQTEDDGGWIDRIAALSMHITGDAHVQNVLYEDITIEDVWTPKMIQFTTFHYYREHGWFSPAERLAKGRISNVRLKNVHFLEAANARVHIEGFNGPDDIENVSFENVTLGGVNLRDREDLVLEVVNTRNFQML
jgi:hypothetical protein